MYDITLRKKETLNIKRFKTQHDRVNGSIVVSCKQNNVGNERFDWFRCRSAEWKLLTEDEKQEIGLTFQDDGEFWLVTTGIWLFKTKLIYVVTLCKKNRTS